MRAELGPNAAMFRLSRLVWWDAARRYRVGLAIVCTPGIYLWKEWPPWVVRDALWTAGPLLWLVVAAAYIVLTLGPTRQLVASERLSYWRQCPISPGRWRAFHGTHLVLLHAPALVALGYALAPSGMVVAATAPILVAALTVGPLAWRLGHPMAEARRWTLRLPRPSTPTTAMARVLTLALTRRRPAAFVGMVTFAVSIALLGRVATGHVLAAGEPAEPAAWGFAAASSIVGTAAAWQAWPLVRRAQWWFDSMNVGPWTVVLASILVASVPVLPSVLVLVGVASMLAPIDAVQLAWVVVATLAWAGAIAFAIDADAVRRRFPEARRSGRLVLALFVPVPLAAWQPLTLVVPAALALLRARRLGMAAAAARRRFELDDLRDDHE